MVVEEAILLYSFSKKRANQLNEEKHSLETNDSAEAMENKGKTEAHYLTKALCIELLEKLK